VAWNPQVPHILATCAGNGSTIVWDLRQKKPYCEMRDPAKGPVADIAWNPDEGLHIVTASGDDNNPVIRLWDLRSSTTHPLATLKGHDQGLLSVSWCPFDSSFLLSTGKDGRTLLWDLHNAQPIYELPAGLPEAGAADGVYGGYGGSLQRRYSATWSPLLPAVVGTCSFNRTVEFYSMTGVRSTSGRAPKWLRRPVAAAFGFGGQFAYVENDAALNGTGKPQQQQHQQQPGHAAGARRPSGRRPLVHVKRVMEDAELAAASKAFQQAAMAGDYRAFCAAKAEEAATDEERRVWAVLQTIVDRESKSQLNRTLGYDEASLAAAVAAANQRAQSRGAGAGAGGKDEDEGTAEALAAGLAAKASLKAPSPAAEAHVKRALLTGGLEAAVDACLEHDLVAEALLLASSPNAPEGLWARTKDAYVSRQGGARPLLRIIDAILKTDLSELVAQADLGQWQETLALINTYSRPEDFGALTELLGTRLEEERGDRASATLCYLCALNVNKAVRYWVEGLQGAGKGDSRALHAFVEKVTIIMTATTSAGAASQQYPEDVAALFAEYADLLAAQGELETAFHFVKHVGVGLPAAILKDRLYRASAALKQTEPEPPRPFDVTQIGLSPSSPQRTLPATAPAAQQAAQQQAQQQQAAAASAYGGAAKQQQQQQAPGAMVSGAGAEAPLPPHWVAVADPSSGRTYYANEVTQETTWERPAAPAAPAPAPAMPQQPAYGAASAYHQQTAATTGYGSSTVTQPLGGATSGAATAAAAAPRVSGAAKPLDYYADSFTSSHGNAALAQKYGNTPGMMGAAAPMTMMQPGAMAMAATPQQAPMQMQPGAPMAQPTIFQPNKALAAAPAAPPAPMPCPVPAEPPKPVEPPAEALPVLGMLTNLVEALKASPTLTPGDKRLLAETEKGVGVLSSNLAQGEVSVATLPQIMYLLQCVEARDFATALQLQGQFAKDLWTPATKDWIKGLKVVIQLAKK
jgi:protein transport protein SEC31